MVTNCYSAKVMHFQPLGVTQLIGRVAIFTHSLVAWNEMVLLFMKWNFILSASLLFALLVVSACPIWLHQ